MGNQQEMNAKQIIAAVEDTERWKVKALELNKKVKELELNQIRHLDEKEQLIKENNELLKTADAHKKLSDVITGFIEEITFNGKLTIADLKTFSQKVMQYI